MKQIRVLDNNVVMLVTIPASLPLLMYPHVGEYDHPYVMKTRPCEKKNGKYFDLRTGNPVRKDENTLEWLVLSGNVFKYPDGQNILLSRRFDNKKLLCLDIDNSEFHQESMILRPLKNRVQKT